MSVMLPPGYKSMKLHGVTATPLGGYLKGLGLLRILGTHGLEPMARWDESCDCMELALPVGETGNVWDRLVEFFMNEWEPSPLWVARDVAKHYLPEDLDKKEWEEILSKRNYPKARYKSNRTKQEERQLTSESFEIRNKAPDHLAWWTDVWTLYQQTSNIESVHNPVGGTGGNEGRSSYWGNYSDAVREVWGYRKKKDAGTRELRISLLDDGRALSKAGYGLGYFDAGFTEAPNGGNGPDPKKERKSNAWDFVLLMEGVAMFRPSMARRFFRYGDLPRSVFLTPFMVETDPYALGELIPGSVDLAKARGDLWVPLWEHFASLNEISQFFREGRLGGGRRLTTSLDVISSLSNISKLRDISTLIRYSFTERRAPGNNYYIAVPVDRWKLTAYPQNSIAEEVNSYLSQFRRDLRGEEGSNKLTQYVHAAGQRLVHFMKFHEGRTDVDPGEALALLREVGRLERYVNSLRSAQRNKDNKHPIYKKAPVFSYNTLKLLRNVREARVALAISEIRRELYRAVNKGNWWTPVDRGGVDNDPFAPEYRSVLSRAAEAFERLLWALESKGTSYSREIELRTELSVDDITAVLHGDIDEELTDVLVYAFSATEYADTWTPYEKRIIDPEYAYLKVGMEWIEEKKKEVETEESEDTDKTRKKSQGKRHMVRMVAADIFSLVRRGAVGEAWKLCDGRLRSRKSGKLEKAVKTRGGIRMLPVMGPGQRKEFSGGDRLAAALALPVNTKDMERLEHMILGKEEKEDSSADERQEV